MAFLKGLTAEQMEVRVFNPEEVPSHWGKEWERGEAKHIVRDVKLDRFVFENDYDPVA